MANKLFKFNNGYEGIIHVPGGYQAAPYFNGQMHYLHIHDNVFRAIEQIGLFRATNDKEKSVVLTYETPLNTDDLLLCNSVMNVRQNLITMLHRLMLAHKNTPYYEERFNELTKKWNIQPKLS